jgi:hypothetical protein
MGAAISKKIEKPHPFQPAESSSMISTSKAAMDELEKDLFLSAKGPPPPPSGLGLLTGKEFEEALLLLKYDMHLEMQAIIKEQIRQFTINQVRLTFRLYTTTKYVKSTVRI